MKLQLQAAEWRGSLFSSVAATWRARSQHMPVRILPSTGCFGCSSSEALAITGHWGVFRALDLPAPTWSSRPRAPPQISAAPGAAALLIRSVEGVQSLRFVSQLSAKSIFDRGSCMTIFSRFRSHRSSCAGRKVPYPITPRSSFTGAILFLRLI